MMKKLAFLILASLIQFANAQEARMMTISVDPYEIEGYGVIEGEIKQIIGLNAPHPGHANEPVIHERPSKKSDLYLTYTNADTRENRQCRLDMTDLNFLLKALGRLKSLSKDSTSVALPKTGITKKTLMPAIVLDDDGVESTYTEEYTYGDDGDFTIGVYTNAKGQAVWYYQFGSASTVAERNKWRILTNESDTFVKWLESIQKAM